MTETDDLVIRLRADAGYCRGAAQNRLASDLDEAAVEIVALRDRVRQLEQNQQRVVVGLGEVRDSVTAGWSVAEAMAGARAEVPDRHPRPRRRRLFGLLR